MARGSKSKSKAAPPPVKPATLPVAVVAKPAPPAKRDQRPRIYAALDLLFFLGQVALIWKVVPNRLPSASFHLWTLPVCMWVLGAATWWGGPRGWIVAVIAGSAVLLSTALLIVRIVVSAAFLAGVYGAFGKAAAMTALMSVALIIEFVALLPIVQVKYLMSRAGRRTFGVEAK